MAAVARNVPDLESLRASSGSAARNLLVWPSDLSTAIGCDEVVRLVREDLLELDTFVHNVGGPVGRGGFHDLADSSWTETFELNVLSAVRLLRSLLPILRESDQARVVIMSSATAMEPGAFDPHYSAAKAALVNFAKHLGRQAAQDGVLVNCLLPGPIWTEGSSAMLSRQSVTLSGAPQTVEEELVAGIPQGRIGNPEDVASAALFLGSGANSWITGSKLHIDGGKSRSI